MRKLFAALAVLVVLSGCGVSGSQPDSTDGLKQEAVVQEQPAPQENVEEEPVAIPDQIEEPVDDGERFPELQPHYQDIVPPEETAQEEPTLEESAPEEPTPAPTAGKESGKFVASKERDKYHTPTCRWVENQMLEENKIWFDSAEDAEAAGFKPCGTCHPKD